MVRGPRDSSKTRETTGPNGLDQGSAAAAALELLIRKLEQYLPEKSLAKVQQAYSFADEKHKGQERASGEPYIIHPVEVASILADIKVDQATIVAAILHDVVEDTETTLEEIQELFGTTVAQLVDGLTKISKIKFRSKQEKLAENFRKMVLAMASDLRVILIKLADRLHNMRTLEHLPKHKSQRIANETLEIYAPLANRLGIYTIKSELEDLCLREAKSEVYQEIKGKVAAKKAQREAYIDDVRTILDEELKRYGFQNAVVYGRPKHFYSIYKKMVDRRLAFEDIHDLFAFRIIVDTVKDCYEALGIVHAMWKPMPGRFKDYIAMPKANLYQSLHTTVIRPSGEPAEIQIRTKEMQKICEFGVAAHWAYKEKGAEPLNPTDLKKFSWLRQIMEWQSELKDPDEFLEAVKVDLFEEEIFVFTPKGDVLQLPIGATALDFAFAVHTDVGLTTVGAKVNGRMISIKKPLQSGDIVEILTSNNQKPNKDWLNFVATSKARNKIRSYLRSAQRTKSRQIGRELLEHELHKRGMDLDQLIKTGEAEALARAGKESNFEDVLIALGYGRINPKDLLDRAFPEKLPTLKEADLQTSITKDRQASGKRASGTHGILVSGMEDVLLNFARCCNPLPGENIMGFITRGRGVTIHREGCARANDMDPHRKIDVEWIANDPNQGKHIAYLEVIAEDRTGVLAEITAVISKIGANIHQAQIAVNADMIGVLDFELKLRSLTQLQEIISRIEAMPTVVSVTRKNSIRQNLR